MRSLFILIVLSLAACGSNQRQETLHSALVAANVARDGFAAWDLAHQKQIVEKATSREQAEAELAAYRAKRDGIIARFEEAYRAIAVAATQDDKASLDIAKDLGAKLIKDLAKAKE